MQHGLGAESFQLQPQLGKKGGRECPSQEPAVVARVVMDCTVLHNLLTIRYPTGKQDEFGGEVQPPILLKGKDIPHEDRNPLEAAKTQMNILRDYFVHKG